MTPCHERPAGSPMCLYCRAQLTPHESHYLAVAQAAAQEHVPLVTKPHSSISPQMARWLAELAGSEVAPGTIPEPPQPRAKQEALFEMERDRTVEAL